MTTTITNNPAIHEYDNGIKIYKTHLGKAWEKRFSSSAINLHEPEEEKVLLDVLNQLASDGQGTFFDIGAAVGYYSILVKKQYPKFDVHAFEPLRSHQKFLQDNVTLNGFSLSDIILHTEAVSGENGSAEFNEASFGSSLIDTNQNRSVQMKGRRRAKRFIKKMLGKDNFATGNATTVITRTLDTVLESTPTPITFAKIDVQGFEVDVLSGAKNSLQDHKIRGLLVGTHSDALHADCLKMLEGHGYNILHNDPSPDYQPDGIIIALS